MFYFLRFRSSERSLFTEMWIPLEMKFTLLIASGKKYRHKHRFLEIPQKNYQNKNQFCQLIGNIYCLHRKIIAANIRYLLKIVLKSRSWKRNAATQLSMQTK